MKPISIIVAVAENNAIGKDNRLLWHVSADLKRFKRLTSGHTIVMGKNTYFSLPVKPLANRRNIIITDNINDSFAGCEMAYSIDEALQLCDAEKENFVIGGASIYRQFLPFTQKLYITSVHKSYDADTFFPEISSEQWEITEKENVIKDTQDDFSYSFITYRRKNYL
ncbi:MAG: dihydrofolate reductase [Bacteroidales bacterium]|nr:dihydrofolate reductase [Bacteroidales bacterium]